MLARLPLSLFARHLAVVTAVLSGVNELGALLSPGFSAAEVVFRVPGRPWASEVYLVLLAATLLAGAFGPVRRPGPRAVVVAGHALLLGLAAGDAAQFFLLVARHRLVTAWPVPFSAVVMGYVALSLGLCLHRGLAVGAPPAPRHPRAQHALASSLVAALLGASLVFHIHSFGLTDYRRPADAILVLGARAYGDGRPSEALAERVATAVALYHDGLSPWLIVSGGVESNGVSESRVMKRLAMEAGVPEEAIVEDALGVNTEASIRNADRWVRSQGLGTVLVVSHYHHLPRIKLLSARRRLACFTVPADEGETLLRKTPYYVLREAGALLFYYLKG